MQLATLLRNGLANLTIVVLICLSVLAVLAPYLAYAEVAVDATATINLDRIAIGDLIQLTVEVTFPDTTVVQMPDAEVDLGPFEMRSHEVLLPEKTPDGLLVSKAILTLSVFQTGDLIIPSIAIPYFLQDNKTKGQTHTEPVKVFVDTLITDQGSDIRDIKAPLEIRANWLPLIVAVFFGVLASIVAIYLWRRRVGRRVLHPPARTTPNRPVDEVALEELEGLRRSELLNRGEIKEYHVEAAEIIRRYLEGRFFVTALEMTSGEILEFLSKEAVGEKQLEICRSFFNQCDLVKFAKLQPLPSRCDLALDLAFDLVHETRSVGRISAQLDSQDTPSINSSMCSPQASVGGKEGRL